MRFAEPWLWLGVLACIVLGACLLVWIYVIRRKTLRSWGEHVFIVPLLAHVSEAFYWLKLALLIVAGSLMLVALTRPQWGERSVEAKREGVDIIVAIDTSLSMLAQDVKPNRLSKAKREVSFLIENVQGDRLGLVAFAGQAFIQVPLSTDRAVTKMMLSLIDVNTIASQGTCLAEAIFVSRKAFDQGETKYKTLILITDGEDHEGEALQQAELAAKEGIRIYTVGLGHKEGAPIPLLDDRGQVTGYKKDAQGKVVMSRVADKSLKQIAKITQGAYIHGLQGGWNLKGIYDMISSLEKKGIESKLVIMYEDRYQFILGLVLWILLLESCFTVRRQRGGFS